VRLLSFTLSILPDEVGVEPEVAVLLEFEELRVIGNSTVTTVPTPTVDCILISPFNMVTMDLTSDRPRPVPGAMEFS